MGAVEGEQFWRVTVGSLWINTSSVVLLMRVHALWQKNRLLGIFLTILAIVSIALGVALLSVQPGVSEY